MAIPVLGRLWSGYLRVLSWFGQRIAMPDDVVGRYLGLLAGYFSSEETSYNWNHDERTLFVTDLDEDADHVIAEETTARVSFKHACDTVALLVTAVGLVVPSGWSLLPALLGLSLFYGGRRVLADDEWSVDYQCVSRPAEPEVAD